MTTTAIICEFNPIHRGHAKLIEYAKTFSDKVICIMSGNFVQRGMPACIDKYTRAKHAVMGGADMVIELPFVYATASATDFAYGGVKLATQLNADYLLFGSECGNVEMLCNLAQKLTDVSTNNEIRKHMQRGVSYPTAVSNALNTDILNYPNNTLALEYIKWLNQLNSTVKPVTLLRENNHESAKQYASSTQIRNDVELIDKYSFPFVKQDINLQVEVNYKDFAPRALSVIPTVKLAYIYDVTEGIENRFAVADKSNGYDNMIEQIKTKRYTWAKLQRITLHAILNLTKEQMSVDKSQQINCNVLAVKSDATPLLKNIDNTTDQLTANADKLYYSLGGKLPPVKLQKI